MFPSRSREYRQDPQRPLGERRQQADVSYMSCMQEAVSSNGSTGRRTARRRDGPRARERRNSWPISSRHGLNTPRGQKYVDGPADWCSVSLSCFSVVSPPGGAGQTPAELCTLCQSPKFNWSNINDINDVILSFQAFNMTLINMWLITSQSGSGDHFLSTYFWPRNVSSATVSRVSSSSRSALTSRRRANGLFAVQFFSCCFPKSLDSTWPDQPINHQSSIIHRSSTCFTIKQSFSFGVKPLKWDYVTSDRSDAFFFWQIKFMRSLKPPLASDG